MTAPGQLRHAYPAYRVYIFGMDVTADVLSVDIKWHVGKAPNMYTVTLANLNDRYIFTTADLVAIFDNQQVRDAATRRSGNMSYDDIGFAEGMGSGVGITQAVQTADDVANLDQTILEQVRRITDPVKQQVLVAKITQRVKGIQQPDLSGQIGGMNLRQLTADAYRYPLQAEDPIFHANDPVRVAFRDPFQPTRWYWMGAGLISDFDDHVDENNQRVLTVVAEGTLKQLRYKRITTNPAGFVDFKALSTLEHDARQPSFYQSGLAKLTLPEVLFAIVFGNDPKGETSKFKATLCGPNGLEVVKQPMDGAGNHNFGGSAVIEYGPGGTDSSIKLSTVPVMQISDLARYQSIIDHEVKDSDLYTMLLEGGHAPSTSSWPRRADGSFDPLMVIDYIGTHPDQYPVDGGRLILLMPASLHAGVNRRVLLQDIIQSAALNTEFTSRLATICDTAERVDFMFYESPRGDLICEFPLYDFDPEDFAPGETRPTLAITHVSDNTAELDLLNATEAQARGPFGSRYIVTKRDTYNFSKGMSDEKVRTQVACPWHLIQGYEQAEVGMTTKEILPPEVVLLRHLLPLYGPRLEQVTPKGFIATKEGALLQAQVTLNRCNADARSLGINAVPNFGVWLNRPIYFKQRNCIGLLVSVDHSIKWNSSVDTRLNLRYIRGWDGLLDAKGKRVYATIGGVPSNPLNYKLLFQKLDVTQGAADKPEANKQPRN